MNIEVYCAYHVSRQQAFAKPIAVASEDDGAKHARNMNGVESYYGFLLFMIRVHRASRSRPG